MEEYTINDFENVLCLKNQLISVPISTLLDVYCDKENFITFLDTCIVLISTDSGFMLFSDELGEKVKEIIGQNRFKYKDKEIVEAMNSIIGYLNETITYSDSYKAILMNGYLAWQEDCRKIEMEDNQIFLEAMAYDALVYCALKENNMELIDKDDMFLSSVNYFMVVFPEIFNDSKVTKLLLEKLAEQETKKGFFKNRTTRVYARETREIFEKIKVKGE